MKIENNVNTSRGVAIGQLNRGKRMGVPVIDNELYIGPGAKIWGHIVIGANAVVLNDVPNNTCVASCENCIYEWNTRICK